MGKTKGHLEIGEWVVHALVKHPLSPFWVGRVRNMKTGQVRYHSTKEAKKEDAQRALVKWVQKLEEVKKANLVGRGFESAFQEFLDLKDIRPSTQEEYDWSFNGVYKPFFKDRLVGEIDVAEIEMFLDHLRKKRKCSSRTRQKHLVLIRSFFKWAMRRRYTSQNPTEGISIPRGAKRRGIALTPQEASRLLSAASKEVKVEVSALRNLAGGGDDRKSRTRLSDEETKFQQTVKPPSHIFLALLIAFHTGLRRGNITGLKWTHIDFKKKRISFSPSEMKANADHEIPIHPELFEVLELRAKALAKKGSLKLSDPVLGEELCSLKKSFRWVLKQAGLPYEGEKKVRFHDLRHTFATWTGLKLLQRCGRHC